jgi:6-pyruvoyltetrahydropterin/6-carboxytetrahydropterin synthase
LYRSSKTYGHEVGLSAAFRQWRADSHCRLVHGYALAVHVEFSAEELDVRNWVVDFGGLKSFKQGLEDTFDHKLLVAEDDPKLALFEEMESQGVAEIVIVPATGCEAFARLIYGYAEIWLKDAGYGDRVSVEYVRVMEHGANSATYYEEKK